MNRQTHFPIGTLQRTVRIPILVFYFCIGTMRNPDGIPVDYPYPSSVMCLSHYTYSVTDQIVCFAGWTFQIGFLPSASKYLPVIKRFSQVSVILSTRGGVHPPSMHCSRPQRGSAQRRCTHPTGMHSCFLSLCAGPCSHCRRGLLGGIWVRLRLDSSALCRPPGVESESVCTRFWKYVALYNVAIGFGIRVR